MSQTAKTAIAVDFLYGRGFDLHAYVSASKPGSGNDLYILREEIWCLLTLKCTVLRIAPETEMFLLVAVVVMSRADDGEMDEGGQIVDCQGSNPASTYNFECNSTQILQSLVFL